jgi:hypothetical protein
MRLGGNGNARLYFRKAGLTDLEAKQIDKKYKSKAEPSYRVEHIKMMNTGVLKRGEAVSEAATAGAAANANGEETSTNLLDNLSLAEQKSKTGDRANGQRRSGPIQGRLGVAASQYKRQTRDAVKL